MTTNILDNLITQGDVLRLTIEYVPAGHNVIRFHSVYKTTSPQYQDWIASVKRFIKTNHPSDSDDIKAASEEISPSNHDIIIGILKAIKLMPDEPINHDHNKRNNMNNINITNNQHNNQSNEQTNSQNVTLHLFLDAIKDELTGKQFKEVTEILQDYEENPEPTKNRLIDKIKGFGGDVLTNIVANILTNPTIYQGLL